MLLRQSPSHQGILITAVSLSLLVGFFIVAPEHSYARTKRASHVQSAVLTAKKRAATLTTARTNRQARNNAVTPTPSVNLTQAISQQQTLINQLQTAVNQAKAIVDQYKNTVSTNPTVIRTAEKAKVQLRSLQAQLAQAKARLATLINQQQRQNGNTNAFCQQRGITDEKQCIDKWINRNNLNRYGDPMNTMYTGGTPLFNEATGQRINRYDYIIQQHPDRPWWSMK